MIYLMKALTAEDAEDAEEKHKSKNLVVTVVEAPLLTFEVFLALDFPPRPLR
jgi:hypothetical protein